MHVPAADRSHRFLILLLRITHAIFNRQVVRRTIILTAQFERITKNERKMKIEIFIFEIFQRREQKRRKRRKKLTMQMRHLNGWPRISASSSRILPLSASITGVSPSLLGDVETPSSCSLWPRGVVVPGSGFTSTKPWPICSGVWGVLGAFGDITASRRASLSFCSLGVPSMRGATTSASEYCAGPNSAASSPSTTRSTSSSSWWFDPLLPPADERLLDDVAKPAATRFVVN